MVTYHVYMSSPTRCLCSAQKRTKMHSMENRDKFSAPEWESAQTPDRDKQPPDGFDEGAGSAGLFDAAEPDEGDLWFLPGPDDDADPVQGQEGNPLPRSVLEETVAMPGPKADQRSLVDVAGWAAAQAALAGPLANLALLQGRLVERLRAGSIGWRQRLALQEAADLSWLAGDRVPIERLALWMALRLTGDAEDSQECVRAGWAVRRLTDGPGPAEDLAGFLGRHDPQDVERFSHKVDDWREVMGQAQDLHPLTQAALSFHIWPMLGLSEGHALGGAAPLPLMEAAVVAARLSMQTGLGRGGSFSADGPSAGAPMPDGPGAGRHFLPLALGGAGGLRLGGTAKDRLRRWLAGADHAIRAALRTLDQVEAWEQRAKETCAALTGRTPPQLITLLRDWPLISAPMAEAQINASRAAIQRNLTWMTDKGLIREITGQGRYRFWTIAG